MSDSIYVSDNNEAYLSINNDGTITVAKHLKPTETAFKVLEIMRDISWNDDQAIKIRELQSRIKKLEDALIPLVKMHKQFTVDYNGVTHERAYYCYYIGKHVEWHNAIAVLKAKEAK